MLSVIKRLVTVVKSTVRFAIRAVVRVVRRNVRAAWLLHRSAVSRNSAYAAATAAVVGGALGFIPLRNVAAAVLAAALGVYLRTAHRSANVLDRIPAPWDLM